MTKESNRRVNGQDKELSKEYAKAQLAIADANEVLCGKIHE